MRGAPIPTSPQVAVIPVILNTPSHIRLGARELRYRARLPALIWVTPPARFPGRYLPSVAAAGPFGGHRRTRGGVCVCCPAKQTGEYALLLLQPTPSTGVNTDGEQAEIYSTIKDCSESMLWEEHIVFVLMKRHTNVCWKVLNGECVFVELRGKCRGAFSY